MGDHLTGGHSIGSHSMGALNRGVTQWGPLNRGHSFGGGGGGEVTEAYDTGSLESGPS